METKKKYFPMYVDISKKKIVVIGGGTIASRRINTLLSFAECITLVAPEVTESIKQLSGKEKLVWIQGEYCIEHIKDADIVLALTNQPSVNHQIKADCRKIEAEQGKRIPVSIADDKELCDFYFPSIVETEEVVIGINSGGTSPGTVKRIRKKIEEVLNSNSLYKK